MDVLKLLRRVRVFADFNINTNNRTLSKQVSSSSVYLYAAPQSNI